MLFSLLLLTASAETRILMKTPTFDKMDDRETDEVYVSFQNGVIDAISGYIYQGEPITIISSGSEDSISNVGANYSIEVIGNKDQNNIHAYFILKDQLNNVVLEREIHNNQIFIRENSSRAGWLMMNEYFGANNNPDKYKIFENYIYTAHIDSIPPNALVYKSNNEKCTTPCSFSDSQKRITVQIQAKGYKTQTHTFDFSEGINVQRETLILSPEDGSTYIQSIPSGATVLIQGEERGKTPLFLQLDPQTYTIRLEEECSSPKQEQIDIDPMSYKKNIFTLNPILVENPLSNLDSDFYIENWTENGEMIIKSLKKGSNIPKCTQGMAYKTQSGHFVFVSMKEDGTPNIDLHTERAIQQVAQQSKTGQWRDPYHFPDPRALLRMLGIKKLSGEIRGESTSMIFIPGGHHKIPYGDYSDPTVTSQNIQLDHDFYMFQKEVGQYLYSEVMSRNSAYFQKCGSDCPVEQISWMDAINFANQLSEKMGFEPCYEINNGIVTWNSGYGCTGFRLPTEEEWRVAAKMSLYSTHSLYEQAWFGNNSFGRTHPSCKREANDILLCDVFGNVAEWIWDSTQAKTEEDKAIVGGDRYLCGGHSFSHDISSPDKYCFPEQPSTRNMNTGFRLVQTIVIEQTEKENTEKENTEKNSE